ncbi:MAG: DNA polymerase II, partial [Polyangiaceae bacterium]|nr:DNA polymerase II [Polyangiaceae bacterium]
SLGLPFAIGRAGEGAWVVPGGASRPSLARVPGRVVLDGIALLRSATYPFERFGLDYVARRLLGRGKAITEGVDPVSEIRRMHADDPFALAAYNLEDCRLVLDIFRKTDLIAFAIERAYLTGLPIDRQGGSIAAFDHLYLPRLHRRGYVAPDARSLPDARSSPGGHVLESSPGLYRNVLAFDFRSLYPSIIRTFAIDPLGHWVPGLDPIPGFEGAAFAREGAILPDIVAALAEARARASAAGNEPLQRAIKILMNSLYGVLGASGCRFFDPRIASSITLRGHEIIERSRSLFEARGLRVIYGDTDSLFVLVDEALDEATCRAYGARLAEETTAFFRDELARELRLESHLELRFEAHYLRFLMPTMRGSIRGSKKRYAGMVRDESGARRLVIRGLEAIRSDWTALARDAQRELLRRVFEDEPFEQWLRETRDELLAGRSDERLVYRRRLRRHVDDYESGPPHVRAARMLEPENDVDDVEYVVTVRGPEPVSRRASPIDYIHYVEKQLAPAVDVVLPFVGTSYDAVAGEQLRLF